MDVLCLAPCKRKLVSGATVTHPKDWSGDVPDEDARRWIAEGTAQPLGGILQPGQQFTPDQAAVLAHVAQNALDIIAQQGANGDPEPEPEADGDDDNGEGAEAESDDDTADAAAGESQDPADILKAMEKDDLYELAKSRGVRTVARKRVDIEADLLKQISAT
jgi:hypothetical protein